MTKFTTFEEFINEGMLNEFNSNGLNSGHGNIYIANKDTKIGKVSIPKGDAVTRIVKGYTSQKTGDIFSNLGYDFDEIENTSWEKAIELSAVLNGFANKTRMEAVKDPTNANSIIKNANSILSKIESLLK
jgi:hypothetical protein